MSQSSKRVLDPDLNEEMLRMVKRAAELAAQLTEMTRPEPGEEGAGEVGEGEEE